MRVLVASATELESQQLREWRYAGRFAHLELDILATGIGMVNTAWALGRHLLDRRYDLMLNVGICGAFDATLPLGSVVQIVQETYTELGAEDHEHWLPLEKLGFPLFVQHDNPHYQTLLNPLPLMLPLPQVCGGTANKVLGNANSIRQEVLLHPQVQVQSMEGAAFFQCALMAGLPFGAVRGISNRVEPRNRAAWQLTEAVSAAQDTVALYLDSLNLR